MREHTAQFKQWFADSKVIDRSGNPLVVFHGTPTHGRESNNRYVRLEQADVEYPQFDTFITRGGGITDSGWLGEGAYFTPDADYAFEFGNFLLPVYLHITRPFEVHDDNTNSRANQLRFLQSVQHLQGLPDALKVDLSMPADERGEELGRDYSRFFSMSELTFEDGVKRWSLVARYKADSTAGIVEASGATPEGAIFNYRYQYQFGGFLLHTLREIGAREFRALLEANGYDGVIDYREAYSDEPPGQYIKEAVAFHPTQVKSSVGNCGRFNPTDASILA